MRVRLAFLLLVSALSLGCTDFTGARADYCKNNPGFCTPLITSFTASATTVYPTQTIQLLAIFQGGAGTIDNGVGAVTSGVPVAVAVAQTTTYTLTVTNSEGAAVTQPLVVTVNNNGGAPLIIYFDAGASVITAGDTTSLLAEFFNGVGTIDHGVGQVDSGVPVTISPSATTTYGLTVQGTSVAYQATTVRVVSPPNTPTVLIAEHPISNLSSSTASITGDPGDTYACTAQGAILGNGAAGTLVDGGAQVAISSVTAPAHGTMTLSCTATNEAGRVSDAGIDTDSVFGVPGAPTQVVVDAGVGSAWVSWGPPVDNGGSPILEYTISTSPPTTVQSTGPVGPSSFFLNNLPIDQSYAVLVTATNAAGQGPAATADAGFISGPPTSRNSSLRASPAAVPVGQSSTVTLTVKDDGGYPLPNLPVALTATGAQTTVSPASGTTNAAGQFQATLSSSAAETDTVSAHVPGVSLATSVTFTNGAACSGALIYSDEPPALATGGLTGAVTVGDFNNDGQADIAAVDQANQRVSVSLGKGNGTFQPPTSFDAGAGAASVALGDFNRDGLLDIAVRNGGAANSFSVFLADGSGGFQSAGTYDAGSPVNGIATADFNGDGNLDLAFTTNVGINVDWGTPTGTFQAGPSSAVGVSTGIATADLNGDGVPDIAANLSVPNASQVVIQLAQGGGFQAPASYPLPTTDRPQWLLLGDLNGDGRPDAVAVNGYLGSTITASVLLADGGGTFGADVDYALDNSPGGPALADFNGDGHLDLMVPNFSVQGLDLLLGDGTGRLAPRTAILVGDHPSAAATADFDGDGRADLALAIPSGLVSILHGRGDGMFAVPPALAVGPGPTGVTAADVNEDGVLDLVTASDDAGIGILLGEGDGGFQAPTALGASQHLEAITSADFNRDGHVDLAVIDSSNYLWIYPGKGNGSFQAPTSYVTGGPQFVTSADFNGDGRPDLLSDGVAGVIVQLQTDAGFVIAPRVSAVPGYSVAVADYNGDGKLDLAFGYVGTAVDIMLGNGDGTFGPDMPYQVGASVSSVATADLDGDGHPDIAAANVNGTVVVLLGKGDGNFSFTGPYPIGANTKSSLTIADLDGDGHLDLAVTASSSNTLFNEVDVLRGNGDGTFQPAAHYTAGSQLGKVVAADFNRDGTPDLAVVDYTGNAIDLLLFTGCR